MTKAMLHALAILADNPIPESGLTVHRIQKRVINALVDDGFARFYPYGKPPTWKITAQGRAAVCDWPA